MTNTNKLKFAFSFDPDEWNNEEIKDGIALEALKIIHEEFGIDDVRLGIKWSKVDEVGLDFYKPYLNYAFESGMKVCLNVGPIKVFRWPEEHVPEKYKSLPARRSIIKSEDEIAKLALSYLEVLLAELSESFSKEYLKQIHTFQADNEPFNKFGKQSWGFDPDYIIQTAEMINKFFPYRKFLVNAVNVLDAPKLFRLSNTYPAELNNLTLGIDYYYRAPVKFGLIKSQINTLFPPIISLIRGEKYLKKKLDETGREVEITEFQMEPWEHIRTPGNSFDEFIWEIKNISKILPGEKTSVIRLWGMELMVKKFMNDKLSESSNRILNLIRGN